MSDAHEAPPDDSQTFENLRQLTQIRGLLEQLVQSSAATNARLDAVTMQGGELTMIHEKLQKLSNEATSTNKRLDALRTLGQQPPSPPGKSSLPENTFLEVQSNQRNTVKEDARQARERYMAKHAHEAVFGEEAHIKYQQNGPVKPRFVLHPGQNIRMWWDISSIILVLFICITLPYRLAFVAEWSLFLTVVDLLIDVFFLVDIAVNFNTAYSARS